MLKLKKHYLLILMQSGDLEKVEMLIEEYDADVNSQGQYGYTPLNWAAEVSYNHTKHT